MQSLNPNRKRHVFRIDSLFWLVLGLDAILTGMWYLVGVWVFAQ